MAKTKKQSTKKESSPAKSPLIDTSFAAESAAKLIGSRGRATSSGAEMPAQESSMFKQMKEGLNKPHKAGVNSMFNQTASTDVQKNTGARSKQVGHNQTFGSDASRAFVPRRTGG